MSSETRRLDNGDESTEFGKTEKNTVWWNDHSRVHITFADGNKAYGIPSLLEMTTLEYVQFKEDEYYANVEDIRREVYEDQVTAESISLYPARTRVDILFDTQPDYDNVFIQNTLDTVNTMDIDREELDRKRTELLRQKAEQDATSLYQSFNHQDSNALYNQLLARGNRYAKDMTPSENAIKDMFAQLPFSNQMFTINGVEYIGYKGITADSVNVDFLMSGITKQLAQTIFKNTVLPSMLQFLGKNLKLPLNQNAFDSLLKTLSSLGMKSFMNSGILKALNSGNMGQALKKLECKKSEKDGKVNQKSENDRQEEANGVGSNGEGNKNTEGKDGKENSSDKVPGTKSPNEEANSEVERASAERGADPSMVAAAQQKNQEYYNSGGDSSEKFPEGTGRSLMDSFGDTSFTPQQKTENSLMNSFGDTSFSPSGTTYTQDGIPSIGKSNFGDTPLSPYSSTGGPIVPTFSDGGTGEGIKSVYDTKNQTRFGGGQ